MEGIRLFSRTSLPLQSPQSSLVFDSSLESSDPLVQSSSDPAHQACHSPLEIEYTTTHLKSTLEKLMIHLFEHEKNLQIRWIPGSFPFTLPSWEMEVFYNGKWLELCGCGMIRQEILDRTGNTDKVGWAFGLGLERIAMVLFDIPDIRLFWSKDPRFINQFKDGSIQKFVPFSKYPSCYKVPLALFYNTQS
jgi:phenylalanyl-tRNA synthetase alpha chain